MCTKNCYSSIALRMFISCFIFNYFICVKLTTLKTFVSKSEKWTEITTKYHVKMLFKRCMITSVSHQADKVQFILNIKDIPVKDARNAEMALLCGNPHDAEAILLQAGLIFRAILLNIQLYNWDRYVAY